MEGVVGFPRRAAALAAPRLFVSGQPLPPTRHALVWAARRGRRLPEDQIEPRRVPAGARCGTHLLHSARMILSEVLAAQSLPCVLSGLIKNPLPKSQLPYKKPWARRFDWSSLPSRSRFRPSTPVSCAQRSLTSSMPKTLTRLQAVRVRYSKVALALILRITYSYTSKSWARRRWRRRRT